MTVAEKIAIGRRLDGERRNDARVGELLDLVDLPGNVAGRMPDRLSGGQRQRVGVARALATAPGLMLMDEPFGALDPVTREQLSTAVRRLHDTLGHTTIMVTHDLAAELLPADRVLVMTAGRTVAAATPGALSAGAGGADDGAAVQPSRPHIQTTTSREKRG